jgi:predicted nucleic acid-binding protein
MVIVSDSSPVIALVACDKLGLLDGLFGQVCIPQAVFDELAVPNKLNVPMIAVWAKDRVVSVKNPAAVRALALNLDPGESEALSLLGDYRRLPAYR